VVDFVAFQSARDDITYHLLGVNLVILVKIMVSHRTPLLFLVPLCLICLNGDSLETSTGKQEHNLKTRDAHVHGVVDLKFAIDDSLLEIELVSPALNLVGFEHRASNQKEKDAVLKTEELLRQYRSIFLFSVKSCLLSSVSIDMGGLIELEEGMLSEHTQKPDHSEIVARYRYKCGPESLPITVSLFDQFPKVVKIRAQWVNQIAQGSIVLTSERRTVKFREQL